MPGLSSLKANAEVSAETLGHLVEWLSNQRAYCLDCAAWGEVSLDPMITKGEEVGTFYHGPLLNEECNPIEPEGETQE